MSGTILGILAFVFVLTAGVVWMRSIGEVRTGERRPLVLAVVGAGVGMGLLAFAREPGLTGKVGAGLGVAVGSFFLLFQVLGQQSRRTPAVEVGGPILDFTAPDADGKPFQLASLAGRPYLLKFFRGHW